MFISEAESGINNISSNINRFYRIYGKIRPIFMEKIIYNTLVHLDLSEKERKFLFAAIMIGSGSIGRITKKARLERSTSYLIAQSLIEKGFLRENITKYKKQLTPVGPKTLLRMLSAKQRKLRRQEIELEEQLPHLEQFYQSSSMQPNVRVFQGQKALQQIWNDVLSTKNEICLWTNQKTESLFFTEKFHEEFIAERIRKRIPIRALAVNNVPGKKLQESDNASLRQSLLLPIQTSFSAEIYLYDKSVAILDYKKDIIGIIIESEPIYLTQKAIFEMTWNNMLKNY